MNPHKKTLIGMIHLNATLSYKQWPGLKGFVNKAIYDLQALEKGGAHAALIENDTDSPCQVTGTADVVAPMAIVAYELKKVAKIPIGIEVLLNDPKASMAIAETCGLDFIRTDYFVDKMTRLGYGVFDINPTEVMAYKNIIKAEKIKIYADLQVKYATMINKHKTIAASVRQAIRAGADGVVITGTQTGKQPLLTDLQEATVAAQGKVPVIIGSGLNQENAKDLMSVADWAIVGSSLKKGDYIDHVKVKKLVSTAFIW